jgi:hypothetical protein
MNEGLITALAIGGFLIILGAVFGLTPGIPQQLIDFFSDFTSTSSPFGDGSLILPAPGNPTHHLEVYAALFNFMIGIAILQIAILVLRLFYHSPFRRISETVGNLTFWLGGALIAQAYLLNGTIEGWFTFWAALTIVIGVSLVVRGILHFFRARLKQTADGKHSNDA